MGRNNSPENRTCAPCIGLVYLSVEGNLGSPQQALELVGDLGRAFYLFDLRRRATGEAAAKTWG